MLKKDEILAIADLPRKKVLVAEWGADAYVFVRTLPAIEKDEWEAAVYAIDGKKDVNVNRKTLRASFCALVMCDEDGNVIFSPGDVEALARKSTKALDRVYEAGKVQNNITEKDIEELTKN